VRYAVIGTGYWGENHARVATELSEAGVVEDVILCDVDAERVRDLARTYGLEYATDVADLDVDSAVLATPSSTHTDLASALLERGIDVLVEKPLALDSERAWRIVETAERNDRTLGVGHVFRYHPALRELKRRIDRGEFGSIKYLHTTRFSFRVPRATTGALYSLAVHDVDIYSWLLGTRPDTVSASLDSFVREGVDETATLTLGYGPATGTIHSSWQVPVFGKQRRLVVVGTERAATIDYLANTELRIHDARVRTEEGQLRAHDEGSITHEVADAEPLKAEVEDFLAASRERRTPRADGRVGARAVEILERAAAAAATDEPVSAAAAASESD
jgi:UDP-N-acetylglucosamine 3-dehydrogenase